MTQYTTNAAHDLGAGWYATFGNDASDRETLTVHDYKFAQSIELSAESLERLRNILAGLLTSRQIRC